MRINQLRSSLLILCALASVTSACIGDPGFTIVLVNPCSHAVTIEMWEDENPRDDVDSMLNRGQYEVEASSELALTALGGGYEVVVSLVGGGWVERQVAAPIDGENRFVVDPATCRE